MKKIFLLVTIFFVSGIHAQIINFPDANFKAKLLQPNVAYDWETETFITIDANGDGEIEISEVQPIRYLDISNSNITDVTGLSYFTNLKWLDCSNNLLQDIVIASTVSSLKALHCSNNLLQSISIDPLVTLRYLDASHNQLNSSLLNVQFDHIPDPLDPEFLTIIDLSYNNLTSFVADADGYENINCSHNPLTAFDLNGASMKSLNLSFTSLTSIQGSGHLKYGYFQNSQFTLLDLTNISFYSMYRGSRVFLGNNPIDNVIFGEYSPDNLTYSSANTFFELGNFGGYNTCNYYPDNEESGNVQIMNCPNLNFLSMKNGVNYRNIDCFEQWSQEAWTQSTLKLEITNCPSLSFICVDEGEQEHIQGKIDALSLQNQVQVNSYCSFTPGGTFYTINGTCKFDAGNNGCDNGDSGIPNFKFSISNGSNVGEIISNASGSYIIPLEPGSYTVTPLLDNAAYFNVSPSTLAVEFPTTSSPFGQDFCITPNGIHNDLEIAVIPANNASPGFDSKYKIVYKNKGNQIQSGDITFTFNDAVLDFVNANQAFTSQGVNTLNWNFSDLAPFESREILVTLNVNTPTEMPPVNGGDILNFTASVNGSFSDETADNNLFNLNQTVVNSFDPNDKTCLEGNAVIPEMIGKYIHYMIRFENTGTANAQNVVVKDMIDTTKFDIDSLVPIDGSGPFVTRINGYKVEFIFENIQLPFDDANNDGYVAFKIKTKPTLVLGDTFSNTANIYFDYNFPVVTNTATTAISALAKSDFEFENEFRIYPNPADNILNIETRRQASITSVSIYNTLGQLVLVVPNASKAVDVSALKSGNYFIKINSDKGTSNSRFLKK